MLILTRLWHRAGRAPQQLFDGCRGHIRRTGFGRSTCAHGGSCSAKDGRRPRSRERCAAARRFDIGHSSVQGSIHGRFRIVSSVKTLQGCMFPVAYTNMHVCTLYPCLYSESLNVFMLPARTRLFRLPRCLYAVCLHRCMYVVYMDAGMPPA